MSRCGCCRWQQNEVVSYGGEASAGFPEGFWPARRLDSCLGSNWGRWPVQERAAALTLANGNEGNICNEAFQLCPWSSYYLLLRVKVMVEGVVDAPLMAVLMPEFLAVPAEIESLKVSLISSSVHHFCCRALVFRLVLLLCFSLLLPPFPPEFQAADLFAPTHVFRWLEDAGAFYIRFTTLNPDVPAALRSDQNMSFLCGIKLGFVGDFLAHCLFSSPDPGHLAVMLGEKSFVSGWKRSCSWFFICPNSDPWPQKLVITILMLSPGKSCACAFGMRTNINCELLRDGTASDPEKLITAQN